MRCFSLPDDHDLQGPQVARGPDLDEVEARAQRLAEAVGAVPQQRQAGLERAPRLVVDERGDLLPRGREDLHGDPVGRARGRLRDEDGHRLGRRRGDLVVRGHRLGQRGHGGEGPGEVRGHLDVVRVRHAGGPAFTVTS